MKHIFTPIVLLAMIVSFASCEKEIICKCECNCSSSDNSDQNTGRPGNDNNGGSNDDNTGGSDTGTTDRNEYAPYNHTFTYGYAGFCGQWYEDLQPANTTNWYIELADDNYDLENYEGTGFNIVLELFAAGTSSSSIPSGKYTVEAFNKNEYSAGSLMYGTIVEDESNGEVPAGTWLFEGNNGIAGATAGWVEISGSGDNYTIRYELYDDEHSITFKGAFSGVLSIYDATEEPSNAQAATPTKSARPIAKHYRVRH